MSWFNVLNIAGLWNGGTPIPVDTDNPLPVVFEDGGGTWGYLAGTSGSVSVPAGGRVQQITCVAGASCTVTIDGGASIAIPSGASFTVEPNKVLVDPTIVFTNTTTYFVSYVI